jgi:large subunit ribosomal protein L10
VEKAKKSEVIEWLRSATSQDETVVFTGFSGLTVDKEGQLRGNLRKAGGSYRVIKNTLLRLGLQDRVSGEALDKVLFGTTSVSIGKDPVAISKTLKEFLKGSEAITLKGVLLGAKLYPASEVIKLADLPSKEQMLGQLAGMLNQPITKVASVLAAPLRDLGAVLNQVKEQKTV